jgi:NAD(P)-dependent dehydrogenase (short-subunit alcohol dehydrogenase family)
MLPVELLRKMWPAREQDAAVCFMAGSNPNKVMDGYSPYNASKMALNKCCEQLDHESPDTKFFTLGPGYVATKIHHATRDAGWPNERIARGNPTPLDRIYDCLQWCLAQPKEVIGGRNICVTDPWGADLASSLRADSSLFKLRRVE